MKNGCLLIECCRQQQSKNLLSLTSISDLQISVSPHRTLNSCQGIIRDRDHDLAELSEEEISKELKSQNVSHVKRFTKKSEGKIVKLNTYLLKFELSTLPEHIYLGPYRIKVDAYVPSPTRCFKCQKFGHGRSSCKGTEKCVKCSEGGHSSFDCEGEVKCSNCGLNHMANSKNCEYYIKEMKIQKLKTEKNISYQEARKLTSTSSSSSPSSSYADKVKGLTSTRSFETQTVFTWPIGFSMPVLVSEFNQSEKTSSSSSQTPSTSRAFNRSETADIYKTANTPQTKQANTSRKSPAKSNFKQTSQSSSSSVKPNGKSRSASADKSKTYQHSDRVKKAEKSLLYQNKFDVLSADNVDNEEVMDTSSNERIESVWGDYPNRGRPTDRTRGGGRFTSCSPNTDERRHGKISPIRAPPK